MLLKLSESPAGLEVGDPEASGMYEFNLGAAVIVIHPYISPSNEAGRKGWVGVFNKTMLFTYLS